MKGFWGLAFGALLLFLHFVCKALFLYPVPPFSLCTGLGVKCKARVTQHILHFQTTPHLPAWKVRLMQFRAAQLAVPGTGLGGGVEWGKGKGEMGEWWGSAQLQLHAKPSFPSLSN